jgi:hypothetical protein
MCVFYTKHLKFEAPQKNETGSKKMEFVHTTIANATLFDMVTILSPAVVAFGYIVYSCCGRSKTEDEINVIIERHDCDEINEKNSKLALMLMMLLTVEPGLNRKYSNLAQTIGCTHIMKTEKESDVESDTE